MIEIWEIIWEEDNDWENENWAMVIDKLLAFLSSVQGMSLWSTQSHFNCLCNIQEKVSDSRYWLGSRDCWNYKAMKVEEIS